jgi:hypothetical protein
MGQTLSHSQRLSVTVLTPNLRAASDWKMPSSNRRFRRYSPTVFGSFGTGIPRFFDGKYLARDTFTTRSQNGNVAHTRRQDAR